MYVWMCACEPYLGIPLYRDVSMVYREIDKCVSFSSILLLPNKRVV